MKHAGGIAERLDSAETLAAHLSALIAGDARLADVAARAGAFELRSAEPGFAGLARIVCGQQLSVASAAAIWSRFSALEGALEPARYLALTEAEVRGAGLSLGKFLTLRAVAAAVVAGEVNLEALHLLPSAEAIAALTRLRGIGPWTAELYLMFSAAHPDIFPAGDLALQRAVQWAFGLDDRPPVRDLVAMAARWSPHRSAAALLFWRYYRAVRNKEGLGL